MKVSDWIAQTLVEHGIRHVFMLTGGGAMHLNHSLGTHAALETVFTHHEQALSMAAEAYCRLTNRLAVVNVTSGPGGTNALTGVYGAYVDSIGMVVISGQVKTETTVRASGLALRQLGDQELDIIEIAAPVTKYAAMVTDPLSIRYHLEKALHLAKSGRPGPVWLDIPLDVQAARLDPQAMAAMPGFDPGDPGFDPGDPGFDPGDPSFDPGDPGELPSKIPSEILREAWRETDLPHAAQQVLERFANAERPVLFAGAGVRISGAYDDFLALIDRLQVPVVSGWNAHDVIWSKHPLYAGRPGTVGDRAGNLVVQSSDVLLVLGSRLNIRQISYNWSSFAREAYKIWVDIDPLELAKPTVKPDMPIVADLAQFLPALRDAPYSGPTEAHREWLGWARERSKRFPVVLPEYHQQTKDIMHPYVAVNAIFEKLAEDDVIVTGNGSACVIAFQTAHIKKGQRLWTNSGCAAMGYDLPAAIGAAIALGKNRRVICIAGDGSIMMNLQELQTIAGMALPVKIFLINNNGYVSIFQVQRNYFNGDEVGAGPNSNINFPDFRKVSLAFGLGYYRVENHDDLPATIAAVLACDGPVLCEMMVDEMVTFSPKLSSKQLPDGRMVSPPLEDLSPFLPKDILRENMRIALIEE